MKIRNIIIRLAFMSVILFSSGVFAQESSYKLITKELTKEQKALLQKERDVMKANREAFKATLTKEQLAILKDKTLSKAQIRQKLVATFSTNQKNLVRNQQVRLRKTREKFRQTLTRDQRKMLKERINKTREAKDRGELRNGPRETNKDGKKKRPVRN